MNANVAIVPAEEVFERAVWPKNGQSEGVVALLRSGARKMSRTTPHPRGKDLLRVKALDRRAQKLGTEPFALDIVVNFDIDGPNAQGVNQRRQQGEATFCFVLKRAVDA